MDIKKSTVAKDLKSISAFVKDADDTGTKVIIEDFALSSLPFSLPKMVQQKAGDQAKRLSNLLGGFPFTSADYPWPKDTLVGKDMQPVAQLDLTDVGAKLGVALGDGLLQVWCAVYPAAGAKEVDPFLLRVVPASRLGDPLDRYFPHEPVWLRQIEETPTDTHAGNLTEADLFQSRTHLVVFDQTVQEKPAVDWPEIGQMFPPAIVAIGDKLEPEVFEQVFESLEALQSCITSPFGGTYLGGYGGAAGGSADPTYLDVATGRLILRIRDEHNLHIGVIADMPPRLSPQFRLVYRFY